MFAIRPFPWHFFLLWIFAVTQSGSGLGSDLDSNVIESRTKTTETTVYSNHNQQDPVQSQRVTHVMNTPAHDDGKVSTIVEKKTTVTHNAADHSNIVRTAPKQQTSTTILTENTIPSQRIHHETTQYAPSYPAVQYQTHQSLIHPQPQASDFGHAVSYAAPQIVHAAPQIVHAAPQIVHAAPVIYPAPQPVAFSPVIPYPAPATTYTGPPVQQALYYVDSSGSRNPLPRFQGQMHVPNEHNAGHSQQVTREVTFYIDPYGFLRALPESGVSHAPHFAVNTASVHAPTSVSHVQTINKPVEREIIYNQRPEQQTKINPERTERRVETIYHDIPSRDEYRSSSPQVKTNPASTRMIVEKTIHEYPTVGNHRSSSPEYIHSQPANNIHDSEKFVTKKTVKTIINDYSDDGMDSTGTKYRTGGSDTGTISRFSSGSGSGLNDFGSGVSTTRTFSSGSGSGLNDFGSGGSTISRFSSGSGSGLNDLGSGVSTTRTFSSGSGSGLNDFGSGGSTISRFSSGSGSGLNDFGSGGSTMRSFSSGSGSGLHDLGSGGSTMRSFSSGSGSGLNDFGSGGSAMRSFSSGSGSGLHDLGSGGSTMRSFSSGSGSGLHGFGSGGSTMRSFDSGSGLNHGGSHFTSNRMTSF